jgi:hypothetical protein
MKKTIILAVLFIFFVQPAFVGAADDESSENSNVIKCDQVAEIINSGNCKNWIVEPPIGVWCNLPGSTAIISHYRSYAATYVFAPGEVCDEGLWEKVKPFETEVSETETTESEVPESAQPQTDQPEENMFKKVLGGFPTLIGEWFQAISSGIKLNAFLNSIESLVKNNVTLELTNPEDLEEFLAGGGPFAGARIGWVKELGIDVEATLGRKLAITQKDEDDAWAFTPEYRDSPDEENITVVKGSDEFVAVDTVFTGSTSEMVKLKYMWEVDSGAVINVFPKAEIKFEKPVQDKKTQDLKRMAKLNKGEVEVKVKNANSKNKFGLQTDFLDLYVIGTHFWVSHDQDKNYTLVGVYDGEVEIQTKDGKTTTITRNGDKPGIFIITQNLSVIKLALSGLVVMVVICGVVLLFKRRKFGIGAA